MRIATLEDVPQIEAIFQSCDGIEPETAKNIQPVMEAGTIILVDEAYRGCFVLLPLDQTSIEIHIAVKPEHRGVEAMDMAEETARMIFTETSVENIYTSFGPENKNVRAFVGWIGFKQVCQDVWRFGIEDWVLSGDDPLDSCMGFRRIVPQEKWAKIYNRIGKILHWPDLKTLEKDIIIQDAGGC